MDRHFVGRVEAAERLAAVLTGRERSSSPLTVQSVEGPGGIGKTCLFDHVLAGTPLGDRHYLTMRIGGNGPSKMTLTSIVLGLIDGAQSSKGLAKPPRYFFPQVERVTKEIDTVRSEAEREFAAIYPDDKEGRTVLGQILCAGMALGTCLNDVSPHLRKFVDFRALGKVASSILPTLKQLKSLKQVGLGLFAKLGLFSPARALRNSVLANACEPLADAMVSDLSAILAGYRPSDARKATHRKQPGIDRLLLVIDDFEHLEPWIGEFLASYLLPKLTKCTFDSVVVVLGRDKLSVTHPAWDQHLRSVLVSAITLTPLSRSEVESLVEGYGVKDPREKERAWVDTEGFPFYVQLWIEETSTGGRSAVRLKQFYDRTTRWMNDVQKGWLKRMLRLREVSIRSLSFVLEDKADAEEAFRWFEGEASVRCPDGDRFRVREYLRSRLADYLKISDPDLYEVLGRRGDSGDLVDAQTPREPSEDGCSR